MNTTQTEKPESLDVPPAKVSFWQAFPFWLKLGFVSFGGPAGQIAIMHQELVERRRWISEGRFLHAPSRGKDVRVDSMANGYWSGKFLSARRVDM